MAHRRCFVQFPHPGYEHRPVRGAQVIGWNKRYRNGKQNPHKRKFMRLRGEWTDEDGINEGNGKLWAWGGYASKLRALIPSPHGRIISSVCSTVTSLARFFDQAIRQPWNCSYRVHLGRASAIAE
ncbi:MAG: hypothetical protein OXL36_12655 [Bryobacterales bacterium]|nr:hypothetical protein [Bryobacterales bacterium]